MGNIAEIPTIFKSTFIKAGQSTGNRAFSLALDVRYWDLCIYMYIYMWMNIVRM